MLTSEEALAAEQKSVVDGIAAIPMDETENQQETSDIQLLKQQVTVQEKPDTTDAADLSKMFDNEESQVATTSSTITEQPETIVTKKRKVDQKNAADDDDEEMDKELVVLEKSMNGQDLEFLGMLKVFYSKVFPFKEFFKWLNYGAVQKNYFARREFSFTLPNDVYLRFHSYSDEKDLKADVILKTPIKIDIGAVYNTNPKNRNSLRVGAFQAMERELVFDIDMTDYDEVRNCCSGANICNKCWKFMTISIKIIDRVIREDFGFQHLLWIYSGRRGVHCWICDERARKLPVETRRAIVGYLEIIKGGENQTRKINLLSSKSSIVHPSISIAQGILEDFFPTILREQDMLRSKENWTKVLALVPDEEIRTQCDAHWTANPEFTSEYRWEQLVNGINSEMKKKPNLTHVVRDIMFQYSYPRLDDHVTTGLNHLLKSPFCVHPKTGRVCVPIDPKRAELFDPFSVPTLTEVYNDIIEGKENTKMKEQFEYFALFLKGLDDEVRNALREKKMEEDRNLAF